MASQGLTSISTAENMSEDAYDYKMYMDYMAKVDPSYIPNSQLVPISIAYGLTFLFGLVGNALVIFAILKYRRMQSVTNVFLLSLSTADTLVIIICVPIKFAKWLAYTWDFGALLCKLVHYIQDVCLICSVLTLVVMSIERYYAIKHPIRAKLMCTSEKARVAVCVVWVAAFIVASPILIGRKLEQVGSYRTAYVCLKLWPSVAAERSYEIAMLLVVLVVPLAVMSVAYFCICRELWLVTYRRHRDIDRLTGASVTDGCGHMRSDALLARIRTTGNEERSRKQVVKMLMAIIIIFVVCWAPTLTDNVLVAFGVLQKLHYGYLKYMRQAFVLLSYINSAVNPIVYAFMSRNFRETFKHALCTCVNKDWARRRRYGRQRSFTTRSTLYHTRCACAKDEAETTMLSPSTLSNIANWSKEAVPDRSPSRCSVISPPM